MKTHLSLIACAALALTACGKSEQSAGSAPAVFVFRAYS